MSRKDAMNEEMADALFHVGRMRHYRGKGKQGIENVNNAAAMLKQLSSSGKNLNFAQFYKMAYVSCHQNVKVYEAYSARKDHAKQLVGWYTEWKVVREAR